MIERKDGYTTKEILEALDICGDTTQKRGCSECPFFVEEEVSLTCRFRLLKMAANLIRELYYYD